MSKRKLNRRQAWRQEKVQQERRQRAERKAARAERDLVGGELGAEQPGLIIGNYGNSLEVEDAAGERRRCLSRQNLGQLVVGDRITWQAGREGGVVSALSPRESLLVRRDIHGQSKPLAANIDQIIVVAAPEPRYSGELIDQYLVAAEANAIQAVLLFNKADLLDEHNREQAEAEIGYYESLGYPTLFASCKQGHGLDALIERLRERVSVFVGQSGVGKSSLVNALMPEVDAAVGALSEQSRLGRHTTSASRLYHLPHGGSIIDSPGVRDFRLWAMPRAELAAGFRELAPHLGHCRFRDCRHLEEPGCALRAAVEDGEVAPQRFESFLGLAEAMEEELRAERERGGPEG